MKWFKHLSGSLNNSFIFELIERFGGDGYLVFFGTLEMMADEFDINQPGISRFSVRKMTKNLQLSRQKLIKILKFCDEKERIFSTIEGDHVLLNCPRLKELSDEYTEKILKKKSGQTPDSNRDKIGSIEEEVEEEVDNKEQQGATAPPVDNSEKEKPDPEYEKLLTEINLLCDKLFKCRLPGFNPYQASTKYLKELKYHPRAVLGGLLAVKKRYDEGIKFERGAWAYFMGTIAKDTPIQNAKDSEKRCNAYKKDFTSIHDLMPPKLRSP